MSIHDQRHDLKFRRVKTSALEKISPQIVAWVFFAAGAFLFDYVLLMP